MVRAIKVIALCCGVLAWACASGENSKLSGESLTLADPFIMLHEGVYYAYGTSSNDGFDVYTSDSLSVWTKHDKPALDKKDSYGDKWFWAPEVYHNPARAMFYLYYSVEEHLCVATSDSPLGPFVQQQHRPMLDEKAIDSSLFIDDDGTPYLFFVRFTNGNVIWAAQLEDDWTTIKQQTLKECITAELPWELKMGRVAEGPSVIRREDTYFLVYSANHFRSQDYGVGYATACSPLGHWVKRAEQPILHKPNEKLVGTGHGAIFKDAQGRQMYVFHAHNNPRSIDPRRVHIAPITIANGKITIDAQDIITPRVK